jgi:hypothetical protein
MISNRNKKSQNRLNYKYNTKSKKNLKGGNYFLSLDKPTIGGLAQVSFVDDKYAQSVDNVNIVNLDPNFKNINNCSKGGSFKKSKRLKNHRNSIKNLKKKYIGGNSNFSPDMNTRKFDCVQPKWTPDCI